MIYVKLHSKTPSEKKQRFHDILLDFKWMTLDSLPNVWWTSFTTHARDQIVRTAQQDVLEAARQAGIKQYEVAVHTGQGRPAVFNG